MQTVSTLDGAFLRMETSAAHMHVAWRGRLRPAPGRPAPDLDTLRRAVAGRLRFVPRFRQRLHDPLGGLSEPAWIDDEHFDISRHVTALADPGVRVSDRRFAALADSALSVPLDRRRPLWHVHLVPRLDDGDAGLLVKIHHALVDGMSAVAVGVLLFDVDPDAPPASSDDWHPEPAPRAARIALSMVGEAAAMPLRAARAAGNLAPAVRALGDETLRLASPSSLNVDIGPRRTLVGHRVALDDILRVKRVHGATHNDVCLAVVTGALRELEIAAGRTLRPLKAMVPVNVRGDDEHDTLGNRISFAFVDLPLQLASGPLRLKRIHAATSAFKRGGRAEGVSALLRAADAVPAVLRGPIARGLAGPRAYNLVVSNVPGPDRPVYVCGAELLEAYPVVPLSEGHALSVGLFTYRDGVHLGLYADPDALPGVGALPEALDRSLRGLCRTRRTGQAVFMGTSRGRRDDVSTHASA
jgi:WS/DGAT/MGAT family acyltransferase